MIDKLYEQGYIDGKEEGFETGVIYGANSIFNAIFDTFQDDINVAKLEEIYKQFIDSFEAFTDDEIISDLDEEEDFGELDNAYEQFERYLVLDHEKGRYVLSPDAPANAVAAKKRFEAIFNE